MAGLHTTIDVIAQLLASGKRLEAAEIQHIRIGLSHGAFKHGGWKATRPTTVVGAQMNVAYTAAVAILDKKIEVDQFAESRINSDDVWQLIERIEVYHEKSFDASREVGYTSKVQIQFRNGETLEHSVALPTGVKPPLSREQLLAKFKKLTAKVIDAKRRDEIINLVLSLETVPDIKQLISILSPEVRSPI